MKKIIVILSLFIPSFLIAQSDFEPMKVKELKLKNGLTVMLSENHDKPQVYGIVAVKAGGKNDPKDATGIAHYLEHVLFKGTETMGTIDYEKEKVFLDEIDKLYKKLGDTTDDEERKKIQQLINKESKKAGEFAIPNEFDKLMSQIGATGVNAFTSFDITAYHNTFPSNQIERWLEIFSHRFEKPVFRLFQSELETVYEEKNGAMDDRIGQVFNVVLKNAYKKHPYGQQTILGSVEHLKNPSLQKMYEFYNTYYVANNMVLALSGDFDIETITPLIEATFGMWRSGEVPDSPDYNEEEFDGREFVKKRLTPIRIGVMVFRTPKNGHVDKLKIDIASQILSNYDGTGFLDKISDEGEIMMAGTEDFALDDYGLTVVYMAPKIVGQSIGKAEKIVNEQIEKLRKGEFSEEYFNAIKLNKRIEIDMMWESNSSRGREMVQSFAQGEKWKDYYAQYTSLKNISKQDVMEIANKYFGDNYLALYSKMGFPKKTKLDKPEFEPMVPKNEMKSEFAKSFDKLNTTEPTPSFVNFNKDVLTNKINDRFTINQVKNPFNEVFDLEIKYGIGRHKLPVLQQAEEYLSLLGTKDKEVSALKEAFQELGASYYFEAFQSSFVLHITGLEENLEEILALTHSLITDIQIDESKVKQLRSAFKANNKMQRSDPVHMVLSLRSFVLYGKESYKLKELTTNQLKNLTGKEMIEAFQKAIGSETTINFVGNRDLNSVAELCSKYLRVKENLEPKQDLLIRDRIIPSQTEIYFVNDKKAVQNHIIFAIEGSPRSNEQMPVVNAFNNYFAGGMSGLVFQEIREYRSLAYTAQASYDVAKKEGKNNTLFAYIGCQADKTYEAIEAMLDLFHNMPEKPERMETIKSSIIEKAQSSKPDFRSLIERVETWKQEGYQSDPNELHLGTYDEMVFEDIMKFYNTEIKSKPQVITIVGNAKRFDMNELKKYGKVTEVKKSSLFVN